MAHIEVNFLSYTLHRAVDLTVIIPSMCFPEMTQPDPHHLKNARYPVLYLLHGYGNNHATWCGYTSVELFAEERNLAVVMLSAENKAYINHEKEDLYRDFISKELPEFICGMFPVSGRKEDTFIAGLSMGGYGALVHGLSNSSCYAAIGSFSGAPHLHGRVDHPENDPYMLAKECADENRRIPVYLACGNQDFLWEENLRFRDHLNSLDYDITWVEGDGFTHEWRFWNQQVEAFMDWIPRTDEYQCHPKRKI